MSSSRVVNEQFRFQKRYSGYMKNFMNREVKEVEKGSVDYANYADFACYDKRNQRTFEKWEAASARQP
jgi:hypothetical protein